MLETLARWLTGIFISLAIGQLITLLFLKWVRNHYKIELGSATSPGIPAYVIGLVERLFFTIIVAFNISATAIAMIGWLTVRWSPTGIARAGRVPRTSHRQHCLPYSGEWSPCCSRYSVASFARVRYASGKNAGT